MKWLRWQGLVLFVLVMTIIGLFWFFLADSIVKHAIQKTGTRIVGAQVELAKADLHLLPLGITLNELQVTNPDRPMSNAVQAQRIEFSLDTLNLIQRKIIIDTLSLDGIRFNTPRNKSGAVVSSESNKEASKPSTENADTFFKTPNFQIPDVKDILAREKLETLEQVKLIQADIDAMKTRWQKRLDQAPDQATFEAYQSRTKKLQKGIKGLGGALKRANEVQQLQKDVDNDLKKIKKIKKDFERDQKALKNKIKQLRAVPKKDIDRILDKYSLSADGLGNLSQLLFGNKIGGYTQLAITWYQRLKPLLNKPGADQTSETPEKPARGEGIFVRFTETEPLPDLLASHADASIIIPAGEIQGNLKHVTTQQQVLGLPLLFDFSGDQIKDIESIALKGSLDHIDPKNTIDQFTATIASYRLKGMALSEAKNLPIDLKTGLADLNVAATIKNNLLDAKIELIMKSTELEVGAGADDSALHKALRAALSDVSGFTVTANVTGPLNNYTARVTSDLDQVLKKAVGGQVKKLTAEFKDQLRQGIMQKIKDPLTDTNGRMSEFDGISAEIGSRLKLGDSVTEILAKDLGGSTKLKF